MRCCCLATNHVGAAVHLQKEDTAGCSEMEELYDSFWEEQDFAEDPTLLNMILESNNTFEAVEGPGCHTCRCEGC